MDQDLPTPQLVFMSGCFKNENESTLQSNFIQSEIQVKVEPDQDSLSPDFNKVETFLQSPGDVKEESLDLDLQILPTGLIPPVEKEEELEITTNAPSPLTRRTDSSSKSKKCTDKQRTARKRKATHSPSHARCSTEQSKTTEQIIPMNSDVSSNGIKCLIMHDNTTQNPKKAGTGRTSSKHHKDERFICETCGKEFQRPDLLTDHVKIHRRQKPYVCDHCGMKFAKPSYLKIHLRRHAGDRPITCDQCDKRFFDTYDLKVHQRDHTGERPYICSECGKGFKRIYILNKHKRTHSKERPFQCSVCGKAYRYGYSYRLHMKDHLDEVLSLVRRDLNSNPAEATDTLREDYESLAAPDVESEVSDSDGLENSSATDEAEGQKSVLTDFDFSSEESCDEEIEDHLSQWSCEDSFWSKYPPQSETRTFTQSCPGPAPESSVETPKDAWELFMSENIIDEILQCTNLGGQRAASENGKAWQKVTKEELKAFIGLSLLIGVERSCDVPIRELFLDPLQNPLFRAAMSVGRYEDLHSCLQFDNKKTRVEREASDIMAAFRNVWELFLINCRKRFIPRACVTLGEQLMPFQGRCKFLQHWTNPPIKCGIKVFWMCDAEVPYAIDAVIYTGRQSDEETKEMLAENTVLKLSSGLQRKGLNITMDSCFTSVPLAEKLFEKSLTMVGALHHRNPHVPPIMKPSKSRGLHSSEFGFCGNVSMVSYVPKRKKAVILLSTMHTTKELTETCSKNKPEVFQYYNRTKGGVNNVLQMAKNYTCKRRTKRWPMLLWYNMLNIAIVNSYTVFIAQHPSFMGGGHNTQRLFMKELVKELVVPQIFRRREDSHGLSKNILEAMERCGIPTPLSVVTADIQEQSCQKKTRKRCCFCRSSRDRKVSSFCSECSSPVCKDHSRMVVICYQCIR